jgi:hypothetical protein
MGQSDIESSMGISTLTHKHREVHSPTARRCPTSLNVWFVRGSSKSRLIYYHLPIKLTIHSKSRISQPLDRFILRLRLGYTTPSTYHSFDGDEERIACTGYKDLFDCLALVHKTRQCEHDCATPVLLKLENDTIIVDRYFGRLMSRPPALSSARIWVCPTVGEKESRWYTLWWLNQQTHVQCRVMLKGRDCCISCAVMQASKQGGEWCVIT